MNKKIVNFFDIPENPFTKKGLIWWFLIPLIIFTLFSAVKGNAQIIEQGSIFPIYDLTDIQWLRDYNISLTSLNSVRLQVNLPDPDLFISRCAETGLPEGYWGVSLWDNLQQEWIVDYFTNSSAFSALFFFENLSPSSYSVYLMCSNAGDDNGSYSPFFTYAIDDFQIPGYQKLTGSDIAYSDISPLWFVLLYLPRLGANFIWVFPVLIIFSLLTLGWLFRRMK